MNSLRHAIATIAIVAASASCGELADETPYDEPVTQRFEIAGGTTDASNVSIVGILRTDFLGNGFICSGTLITPNLVLTAKHCVAEIQPSAECGQWPFGGTFEPGVMHVTFDGVMPDLFDTSSWAFVDDIHVPPASTNDMCGNDVAVLELESTVSGSVAPPVTPRFDDPMSAGLSYTAVGFGQTGNGTGGEGVRRSRSNQVIDCVGTACAAPDAVVGGEFVGSGGPCPGDSGGPALDQQGRVMGVASRAFGNCEATAYVSVTPWKDWLSQVVRDAASSAGYSTPGWATEPTAGGGNTGGPASTGDSTAPADDTDQDGVAETADNCPIQSNPTQADLDGDGLGDVCDPDADGDGFMNGRDNCPLVSNPEQWDFDSDGRGDPCDQDDDADGVVDTVDNCPFSPNTDQTDVCGGASATATEEVAAAAAHPRSAEGEGKISCDVMAEGDIAMFLLLPVLLRLRRKLPDGSSFRRRSASTSSRGIALLAIFALSACADIDDHDAGIETSHQAIEGGFVDNQSTAVVGMIRTDGYQILGGCSGSLIAPNLVLTAQHCVVEYDGEPVFCGSTPHGPLLPVEQLWWTTETDLSSAEKFYQSAEVFVPTPSGSDFCGTDVALVRLSTNVPLNEARPLVPRIDLEPRAGESYAAAGYGVQANAKGEFGTRRRVENKAIVCAGAGCDSQHIHDGEFVGNGGPCSGDSGGPVFDEAGRIIGVNSRAPADCSSLVAATVAEFANWLRNTGTRAASAGGYAAPQWATTGKSTSAAEDYDRDGVLNIRDNCVEVENPSQLDRNGNGLGDACDNDFDEDGIPDGSDNCSTQPNPGQENWDGDKFGDACDRDDDDDGVLDIADNCRFVANPQQDDVCQGSKDFRPADVAFPTDPGAVDDQKADSMGTAQEPPTVQLMNIEMTGRCGGGAGGGSHAGIFLLLWGLRRGRRRSERELTDADRSDSFGIVIETGFDATPAELPTVCHRYHIRRGRFVTRPPQQPAPPHEIWGSSGWQPCLSGWHDSCSSTGRTREEERA